MCVSRNNDVRSRKHFYIEKALSITYSKCLCVIYPARKSLRRLILSAVTRLILVSYFPTLGYLINCTIFGKSLLNLILSIEPNIVY